MPIDSFIDLNTGPEAHFKILFIFSVIFEQRWSVFQADSETPHESA